MSYTFTSDRSSFNHHNARLIDFILGHMALDIDYHLKTDAGMPVSNTKASGNKRGGGGHMKSETRAFKNSNGKWRVEIDKAYAAYQERGMRRDGSHVVRNYSTPGTSAGFFHRAIEVVARNRDNYIDQAKNAVGL